jgi:Bardet-Biedl syndrome 9 protein
LYFLIEKIVVASLQGIIRIYQPSKAGFSVEDLIHEENTGKPILQVLSGRFIPSSPNMLALAVLHPRSLVVYELVATISSSGRVSYYSLTKLYEHRLGEEGKHFTAFNMTSGPFGSISGRDMIMVQSLDGKLQFFEQSAEAFSRQLVDALVPGPLVYLPKLDAFITANYSARLECYRYQVLVNAQSDIGALETASGQPLSGGAERRVSFTAAKGGIGGSSSVTAQRGAMAEWTLNLGEQSRQIISGKFTQTEAKKSGDEVLILSDRSLFLVRDTGVIIQQRRLEQDPSCIYSFPSGIVGQGHNFLLATYDQMLQVYCDFNLSWACKVIQPHFDFYLYAIQSDILISYVTNMGIWIVDILQLRSVPVQMAVSTFGQNNRGMIVTIDDRGIALIYIFCVLAFI